MPSNQYYKAESRLCVLAILLLVLSVTLGNVVAVPIIFTAFVGLLFLNLMSGKFSNFTDGVDFTPGLTRQIRRAYFRAARSWIRWKAQHNK